MKGGQELSLSPESRLYPESSAEPEGSENPESDSDRKRPNYAISDVHLAQVRSPLDRGVEANDSDAHMLPCNNNGDAHRLGSPRSRPRSRSWRSFSIKWTRSNSKASATGQQHRNIASCTTIESVSGPDFELEGVALSQAVKEGLDLTVQTLLETSYADMNSTDERGFTPVMQAAWHGQAECLRILLNHKADPMLSNSTGCSAIHLAAGQGQHDCLKTLLDHGVPVNARTHFGATPLILAAKSGHGECLKTLLSRGADAHARYRGNQSALMFAACYGHYECAQLLLKHGMSADDSNSAMVTPLMRAAQHGHNDCLVLLLEHGADHSRQDINGRTAMHYAAEGDNPKAVKILLKYGADPEVPTKRGSTTYMYCDRYASFKCKEVLEGHHKRQLATEFLASKANNNVSGETVSCIKLSMIIRRRRRKNASSCSALP